MVLMIVAYAVFAGDFAGASFGLFAGLTFDIYLGKYLGFMTLLCFLIGYFSGKSHKTFYRDSYIVYLILVFICTVCYELAFYVLTLFFINDINALLFLRTILFPKVLYTVVGTIIVYPLMCLVNALIERREHRLGFKL
jgi:rod shape-determining protein MreD